MNAKWSADSGNRIAFYFCPECGSTVYYEMEGPVYETYKHAWVSLPGDIEHID